MVDTQATRTGDAKSNSRSSRRAFDVTHSTGGVRWLARCAAGLLIPPCAYAVRHPHWPGRRMLWNCLCQPYLAWRPHDFQIRTGLGFTFAGNTTDMIPRYVYYFGTWEPAITTMVRSFDMKGRTFIDVGANHGWYSLVASRLVGPTGRVVAIEASPSVMPSLERNLQLNRCSNVRVLNTAAWKEDTELELYVGPADNIGATTTNARLAEAAKAPGETHRVVAAPLSALLSSEEVRTAAAVKIDVEGAEAEVVAGMIDLLSQFPADVKILMELTPDGAHSQGWVLATMRQAGFRAFRLTNEYHPNFYLNPPVQTSHELTGPLNEMADVMFSRQPL